MGLYNTLDTEMTCPRCGAESNMEIECFFGLKNQIEYKLGDRVEWRLGKAVQNGGRPEGGNLDGEGYAECPICKRDFFILMVVVNDIIQGVKVNPDKKPYICEDSEIIQVVPLRTRASSPRPVLSPQQHRSISGRSGLKSET